MATREELLATLYLIEPHARTEREAANLNTLRSVHLMFDADDPARPTAEDLRTVETWIEAFRGSVAAQVAQLGDVLSEIGE